MKFFQSFVWENKGRKVIGKNSELEQKICRK